MIRELLSALGIGVAIAALRERRKPLLGTPIKGDAALTPHGDFGANRPGPPRHRHQGVDLRATPGTHVLAVGDGQIVTTQAGLGGIVRKLELDHPMAFAPGFVPIDAIVYADLGSPLVEPGARVHRGQAIALVGERGFVHFAVKLNGGFIDPRLAGFVYSVGAVS